MGVLGFDIRFVAFLVCFFVAIINATQGKTWIACFLSLVCGMNLSTWLIGIG